MVEIPLEVINDGRGAGAKSYMWVHRSGEYYKDKPLVLYEYQKTRWHERPKQFYGYFEGILVTDGLSQNHLLEKELGPD